MLGSPLKKVTKMLNNAHYKEAFFKLILNILRGFKANKSG